MTRKRNLHETERRWRTLLTRLDQSGPRASARVYILQWAMNADRHAQQLRHGLALFYKRLEGGTFALPSAPDSQNGIEIAPVDPALLLGGIDLRSAKRRKRYSQAA